MARFVIHVKELTRKKPQEPKTFEGDPGSEGLPHATPIPISPDYEVLVVGHPKEPLNHQRASDLLQIVNSALGRQEPFSVESIHAPIPMYPAEEDLEHRVAAYQLTQTPAPEQRVFVESGSDWQLKQIIRRTKRRELKGDSHVPMEDEHGLTRTFARDVGLARQIAQRVGSVLTASGHKVYFRGMRRGE